MVHQKAPDKVILVTETCRVPLPAAEKEACCLNGPTRNNNDFGSDMKLCSCKGFDADVSDSGAARTGQKLRNRGLGDQGNVWCDRKPFFCSCEEGSARSKVENPRFHAGVFEWIGIATRSRPVFWSVITRSSSSERMCAHIVRIELRLCKRPAAVRHPVPLLKVNRVERGVADTCFGIRVANTPAVACPTEASDMRLNGTRIRNIPSWQLVIKV